MKILLLHKIQADELDTKKYSKVPEKIAVKGYNAGDLNQSKGSFDWKQIISKLIISRLIILKLLSHLP